MKNSIPLTAPRVKAAAFVCLPKAILNHPSVAHRDASPEGLLTVFEYRSGHWDREARPQRMDTKPTTIRQ